MANQRQQQVGDLIQRQLAELLKKEVHDPRLAFISLTAVSMSPDLKQAKVFYTLFEERNLQEVQKAFHKATGYLQHLLAEASILRYIPKLRFVYDESIERADKISLLIKRAIQDDTKE